MSDSIESTICPTCNGELREGQCPVCAGQEPVPSAVAAPAEKVVSVRSLRRWLVVILLLLILFSGGYYVLEAGEKWERRVPTSLLLLMGSSRSSVANELMYRLDCGELSPEHMAAVLKLRIDDPVFELLSPFPAGVDQLAVLNMRTRLTSNRWAIHLEDLKLTLDGEEIEGDDLLNEMLRSDDSYAPSVQARIPPQEDGDYILRLDCVLKITDQTVPEVERVPIRFPYSIERSFTIRGSVADYVDLDAGDEELILAISEGLAARVYCWNTDNYNRYQIEFVASDIPIGLSASVWVRAGETFEYVRVGELVSPTAHSGFAAFNENLSLDRLPHLTNAGVVDVRLLPDLHLAVKNRMDRSFGGVIGWSSVPIRRPPPEMRNWGFTGPWVLPDEVAAHRFDHEKSPKDKQIRRGV